MNSNCNKVTGVVRPVVHFSFLCNDHLSDVQLKSVDNDALLLCFAGL